MSIDKEEMLAYKIAEFLKVECSAFDQREKLGQPYNRGAAVWHGCYCSLTGDFCHCVWHLTNSCYKGGWDMPFLKKEREGRMRFETISDLVFQAVKDGACDTGIEWVERQVNLEAVFKKTRMSWRAWCLYRGYEQFAEHCNWNEMDDGSWNAILNKHPQYAKYKIKDETKKEKKTCESCGWFSFHEGADHGICMKVSEKGWGIVGNHHYTPPDTPACNAWEEPKWR